MIKPLLILISWLIISTVSWAQPSMVSTTPGNNQSNVLAGTSITLTFSEPMNALTASDQAIRVQGSFTGVRTIGGTFTGTGTNTISFTPALPFLPGEQVWVMVNTQAANTSSLPPCRRIIPPDLL